MILTITMNPAIDKTIQMNSFIHGGLNRISNIQLDAGGKGINVSKTIKALGGESIALGFLAGNTGISIKNTLDKLEIKNDFVWVSGETRTNTKIMEENGVVTELNEMGPEIPDDKIEELLEKISFLTNENTLVVLAGSVPENIDRNIYKKITELVHRKKGMVLMDADGELFRNAIEASPEMIKPNHIELSGYIGGNENISEDELIESGKKLMKEKNISLMAISMGSKGATFLYDDICAKCSAVPVECYSTVGAGDAMVAGMAYAWENNLSIEEMIRLCMAVSAGAVTTKGTQPPKKEFVDALKENVDIILTKSPSI